MATTPLVYTYFDAYLKGHVTLEREARAVAEVATFGSFASDWTARLVVLRAYVITCLECQAAPDDLFAQKLKHYRQEFDTLLVQARNATPAPDGKPARALFSINLERA